METQLPPSLFSANDNNAAVAQLASYYSATTWYTGAKFDTWTSFPHSASADTFTADDVLAVTFLSVAVPPLALRRLLVADPERFNEKLACIPVDQAFWEAGPPRRSSPQWQLEADLLALPGVGLMIASKLMARKRPHLVPVLDSVVRDVLGLTGTFWAPLYKMFSDAGLRDRLEAIRAEADDREDVMLPRDLSLLRVLDVITWMDGKAEAEPVGDSGWDETPVTSED